MHEMTLAMNVVQEVERCLDELGPDARVMSVTLQVGGLRAVVPEALTFCFEAAATRTRVEGAHLIIEEVPVMVACDRCDHEWTVTAAEFMCPTCEGPVRLLQGKELLLRAIEVEDGE